MTFSLLVHHRVFTPGDKNSIACCGAVAFLDSKGSLVNNLVLNHPNPPNNN